ncbi:MAG: hypothetical protein ACKOC5_17340 [Chloroflexota bacterium]
MTPSSASTTGGAILYDGWALIRRPGSPAALHLLSLLAAHPPDRRGVLALPGPVPPEMLPTAALDFLDRLERAPAPVPDTPAGRLAWEQRILPRLARQAGAGLLHAVGGGLALFAGLPALYSPTAAPGAPDLPPAPFETDSAPSQRRTLAGRLAEALGQGGLARARAVLWPADFPAPQAALLPERLERLPFGVPAWWADAGLAALAAQFAPQLTALPDAYVYYRGPLDPPALQQVLAAWSWAARAVGADTPLVVQGGTAQQTAAFWRLANEWGLSETLRWLEPLPAWAAPAVMRGCRAFFYPLDPPAWGDPLRLALALGRPLVGLETARSAAVCGPAGYLVPRAGESAPGGGAERRALGAALISVLVEQSLAQELGAAALQQAQSWPWAGFQAGLAEAYRRLG